MPEYISIVVLAILGDPLGECALLFETEFQEHWHIANAVPQQDQRGLLLACHILTLMPSVCFGGEMNFSSSLYKLNVCTLYFIFSPNPRAFHRLVANLHN